MAFKILSVVLFALSSVCLCFGHDVGYPVTVTVEGVTSIGSTDDQYICATLDWWPENKCDYNMCPWDHSCTILTLDLNNTVFVNAIKAFNNLRIRIGGSLQDQVTYKVGKVKKCPHFKKHKNEMLFGFSRGCLPMKRWDEINYLFNKTGAQMTFGLNALMGRKVDENDQTLWVGNWNPSNAIDFINYTISRGYKIHSFELGNELAASGVSARVDVEQYAKDIILLKEILKKLYPDAESRPKVIGPAGFFEKKWFARFMEASGQEVVDGMTHHIYNMGPGGDPKLIHRMQDPYYLDNVAETFKDARDVINNNGPWSQAWVGESGGAYNSGGKGVQTSFISGFWYLDQLGMAATFDHKVYCRQALVGGNYGLLSKKTFVPNPDYYSALLWHRIMGSKALAVSHSGPPSLRVYAHCLRNQEKDQNGDWEHGIAILMINMDKHVPLEVNVVNEFGLHPMEDLLSASHDKDYVFQHRLEYRLTPKDGDVQSNVMLLNGKPLELTHSKDIPTMDPDHVDPKTTIFLEPHSYTFAKLRYFKAPACN